MFINTILVERAIEREDLRERLSTEDLRGPDTAVHSHTETLREANDRISNCSELRT
jgi:hypothetical protein